MKSARNRIFDGVEQNVCGSDHVSKMVFFNQIMRSTYDLTIRCKAHAEAKNALTGVLDGATEYIDALFENVGLGDQNACHDTIDKNNDLIDVMLIRNHVCVKSIGTANARIEGVEWRTLAFLPESDRISRIQWSPKPRYARFYEMGGRAYVEGMWERGERWTKLEYGNWLRENLPMGKTRAQKKDEGGLSSKTEGLTTIMVGDVREKESSLAAKGDIEGLNTGKQEIMSVDTQKHQLTLDFPTYDDSRVVGEFNGNKPEGNKGKRILENTGEGHTCGNIMIKVDETRSVIPSLFQDTSDTSTGCNPKIWKHRARGKKKLVNPLQKNEVGVKIGLFDNYECETENAEKNKRLRINEGCPMEDETENEKDYHMKINELAGLAMQPSQEP
ncbi:hypothetical protein DH2020_025603 [Rehmannia glutinosa]|uniref:Uncharacterized protein n=1 Tax=Rehmannia glutinosa TaxID=99300 RepID=A0ABR0W2U9_REHGL